MEDVKTPKKGTQKTEVFIGQSAARIEAALTALSAATKTLENLPKHLEELTFKITNSEQKLKELEVQYAEKKRQSK